MGVDLGTRYALVAHCPPGGSPRVLPNRWGRLRTPSYVALSAGRFLAGDEAVRVALTAPDRAWWDVKRKLGSDWVARHGGRAYGAEDLLVPLLSLVREDAEAALGSFVRSGVLAVPAHFGFPERGALGRAARNAGFEEVRIVNEPTAAALSVGPLGRFLVLDFGGGTLDLSVVEGEDGVFQVLDSLGRSDLGGYDLDRRLALWLWRRLGEGTPNVEDPRWAHVLREAEQLKIALSDARTLTWTPPPGLGAGEILTVHREDLEHLIAPVVEEILRLVERLYRRHQPHRLLLVGGSSRVPLLRRRLAERVAEPERLKVCPDEAVALGASLFARQGRERLLLDVLSQSLGVADPDGSVVPLLQRGTPLPAEAVRELRLSGDGPYPLLVVQGEGPLKDPGRILQRMDLPATSPGERVTVSFRVDGSGLLTVEVFRRGGACRRVVALEGREDPGRVDLEGELRLRQDRLVRLSLALSPPHQERLTGLWERVRLFRHEEETLAREALEVLDRLILELERAVGS